MPHAVWRDRGSSRRSWPRRPCMSRGPATRHHRRFPPRQATGAHSVRRHAADVAGTHGEQQVAVVQHAVEHVGQRLQGVDEHRLDAAARAHRAAQGAPVGAGDGRLAGRVDLEHQQHVDVAERRGEVLEEVAGARVAMRLERQHQAPLRPRRRAACTVAAISRGVVGVVVDQRARCRPALHARRGPGAAGRCPESLPAHACTAASSTPTRRATAIAASALSTLCRPGRFRVTGSGAAVPFSHGEVGARAVGAHVHGAQVGRRSRSRRSPRGLAISASMRGARSDRRRTAPRGRRTAGGAGTRRRCAFSRAKSPP